MAPRKKRCRHILQPPGMDGFSPSCKKQGREPVSILYEEYEAVRLADYEHYKHDEAARHMNVSRATFARIYEEVRKKIAMAFVESRPIKFEAGCAFLQGNEASKNLNTLKHNFNNTIMNKTIAIPTENGVLATHFGHAAEFAFIECDGTEIKTVNTRQAPPHQPGLLPAWVAENGGNVVIAGGMGHKAIELFRKNNIDVVTGAPAEEVKSLARQYVEGKLTGGDNRCDH